MMFCSRNSMAHREAKITHSIVSSAGARQSVSISYVCVAMLWRLPIARKRVAVLFICANSRPCDFFLVSSILFVLAVRSCGCRHSFSDFVGSAFLTFVQMPTFAQRAYMGNVRASVCRFRVACIRFIPLSMRGIDTLVLYIAFQLFEYWK